MGSFVLTYPGEFSTVTFVLEARISSTIAIGVDNAHREVICGRLVGAFTRNETTPRLMAFVDDLGCVFLVLGLGLLSARDRGIGLSAK